MSNIKYRAREVAGNDDRIIEGYYAKTTLGKTDAPQCLGDCRIHHIIIKDGDMYYVQIDSLEITFNNGLNWHKAQTLLNYDDLLHFHDVAVGLWATDLPDKFTENKELLFEIKGINQC